jgi:hypothetical protein
MAAYLHSVGGGRSSANLFWVLFWILVSIVDVSQLPILPKKNSIEISTISNILAPLSFPLHFLALS